MNNISVVIGQFVILTAFAFGFIFGGLEIGDIVKRILRHRKINKMACVIKVENKYKKGRVHGEGSFYCKSWM